MFRTRIKQSERGLLYRDGEFIGIRKPGIYWDWQLGPLRTNLKRVSILDARFEDRELDMMLEHSELRDELLVVDLKQGERALVWKDGRLLTILGSGKAAFWKGPYTYKVEKYQVSDLRFEHERLDEILARPDSESWFNSFQVESFKTALLFKNGQLLGRAPVGRSAYWKDTSTVSRIVVDLREQVADVAGQDIMSQDKVSLRVNLVVSWKVVDPEASVTRVSDAEQSVYREAQLALRAAVGARSLDALLADKESVGEQVAESLDSRCKSFGVQIEKVGLKDIILPGEMKQILNQVIEAEKRAQANLIQRREETAAARSQANTARLLADNPVLTRMKELESLERMLSSSKVNFVLGQSDLLGQLRGVISPDDRSEP